MGTWKEEKNVTRDHPVYTDLEEKLNDLVDEVSTLKEKTNKERQAAIDDVEFLDGTIVRIAEDFKEMSKAVKIQITQIKNSDVNNGTEFYRLRSEINEELQDYKECIKQV